MDDSVLPIQSGRRWHKTEALAYGLSRFYDPDLQTFITPDTIGAWGDAHSLGNPYPGAGNNPYTAQDTGNAVIIPVLIYLGITALIAVIETGVEYGISAALGDEEFDPLSAYGRNFAVGALTNWIPGTAVGRVGGKIAGRAALRLTARAGISSAARFTATRLAYRAGVMTTQFAGATGIEWTYEQTFGKGASLSQVAGGNLLGASLGAALNRVLGKAARGVSRVVEDVRLRRSRQWLTDPSVPVGGQHFIGERQGVALVRRAAALGLDHEFGVIRLPDGRTVLRKGERAAVPFLPGVEIQIAHYHPPGGPWLRRRLPAPRDVEFHPFDHSAWVYSRRSPGNGTPVSSWWTWRSDNSLRLTVDHLDDMVNFVEMASLLPSVHRQGNTLIFRSLEDYSEVFFGYGHLMASWGL